MYSFATSSNTSQHTSQQSLSNQDKPDKKKQAVLRRFKRRAIGAIRRYKHYAELGRDFRTNAEVAAFYNETLERIANLQDNQKRARDLYLERKQQLDALNKALKVTAHPVPTPRSRDLFAGLTARSNDSSKSVDPAVKPQKVNAIGKPEQLPLKEEASDGSLVIVEELITILKDFARFSEFSSYRKRKPNESDKEYQSAIKTLKLKYLILDKRRALFVEKILAYLNDKNNLSTLEGLLAQWDQPYSGEDKILGLLQQMMHTLGARIKDRTIEETCFLLKDKLTKLKENSDFKMLVFQACGNEFNEENRHEDALLALLQTTSVAIEEKQSQYDTHAQAVIGDFEGNIQVILRYIEDFFKQYRSNPPHTSAEIIELASLAALKNHKPTLNLVRENLVNEIRQGSDEQSFRVVSAAAVEGFSVAIGLFPPEYLNDHNDILINIAVRMITVIADRVMDYNDHEKSRIMIAIRNMVEGIASRKSLERAQKSTGEYADDIITFMKTKVPANPFSAYRIFQTWLKKSDAGKATQLLHLTSEAIALTNLNLGITKDQRTQLNQSVLKLHSMTDNQPILLEYVHASIKAEVSNIPTQGEPSSLERVLTTIWHTSMIAKSVALIVTSSGALLVSEGIELVNHLIALIPKPDEKPQEWNKYAKDLRALRAQSEQLLNAEFSAQVVTYCNHLITSGCTNLNLEYEIFRSLNVALKTCENEIVKAQAVSAVCLVLKGDTLKGDDTKIRRKQALNMMLDFMTCADAYLVEEAYEQLNKLQTELMAPTHSRPIRSSWRDTNIRPLNLTAYQNKAKLGECSNHAQLAYDDEVIKMPSVEASTLVSLARQQQFKFQDTIASLTQVHKRLEKPKEGLYLSVNGHADRENKNTSEWSNIVDQIWKFLENNKIVFILHGDRGAGKREMVDHLVDLLLRYRYFGSFYPIKIHLKKLIGLDIVQQALQAEGWPQDRIEALRQRFSAKAASFATKRIPDPTLPELLLIFIGVGAEDCPPQFMQYIKERWGREFKCLIVTGTGACGLTDYAHIFSSSLTQKQVREKVQEFYIKPQVTREHIEATLSHDAATREYHRWMTVKKHMSSPAVYIPQETDEIMLDEEDFPPPDAWVKKHYQRVFSQNAWLRDLATSPIMLRMLIKMVPKLFAGKCFQQAVSREAFLDEFTQTIFEEKLARLKIDEPTYPHNNQRSRQIFVLYSRKAALHILRHKRPLYGYSDDATMETSAKTYVMETDKIFFDVSKPVSKYGLELSSLVQPSVGQYDFINTEVWIYFAIDGLYHEIIDCVDGHLREDSILNHTLLYEAQAVFRGLLNRIRIDMRAQTALYKIVMATKINEKLDIAASNAMTLLVRVRSFSGHKELARTSFSKANLNGGIFDFFCADGINMSDVSIERCDFSHASTNNTKLGQVKLKEPDTYKMGETISNAAFDEEGNIIVLASETGSVACYKSKVFEKEKTLFFLPGYRYCMPGRCKKTNQIAAVANGWLEVWSISAKATIVGPAYIGDAYEKAQGLSFCEAGNAILVRFPSQVLIYSIDQLKIESALNLPQLRLSQEGKWDFKLSYNGEKVAYFFYDKTKETIHVHVVAVNTGSIIMDIECSQDTSSQHLIWLGKQDCLLVQTNQHILLWGMPNRTRTIQATRYEIFEDQDKIMFFCGDKLEQVGFNDLFVSTVIDIPTSNASDFDPEKKHIFLDKDLVEQIQKAISYISTHKAHIKIERHDLSSDKKYIIISASERETCTIFIFEIESQTWLPPITVKSTWLELACIDLVRNKLIIYQNWKQVYLLDIKHPAQPAKAYNLNTDVGIDCNNGTMDFVADLSSQASEHNERAVLLDLDSLQEIEIIPQSAATVSLSSNNPLIFNIQRNDSAYQLHVNNDQVSMRIAQNNTEINHAAKETVVTATDGKGLFAIVEKRGRLRLERHDDKDNTPQVINRLFNVPDIVALHFIPDHNSNEDDTQALIVVCADGTIIFWGFHTDIQEEVAEFGHDTKIVSAVYSAIYNHTLTLDMTGQLIKWDTTRENQIITLPSKVNEMTSCPSGKHVYLFNKQQAMLYKLDLDNLKISKTWSEVAQYCVMRRNETFIYLTKNGLLFSQSAELNDNVETQVLGDIDKVKRIHYLPETDKLLVRVSCNLPNMPIIASKLMVYSDTTFSNAEAEYLNKRYCYTTKDGAIIITRNAQGKFFSHTTSITNPIEITADMLEDVHRVKTINLVADRVVVHYIDNRLRIWNFFQKKLSAEVIENVDEYLISPNHPLIIVRQGMTLSFYHTALKPDGIPSLLLAGQGYRTIQEVQGFSWLNDTTFASFHTNHSVKIWQVTQTGCRQLDVLGSRRFYCEGMLGNGMDISSELLYRLEHRGAKLNTEEPVAHQQIATLETLVKEVTTLKKQNQILMSEVRQLTLIYGQLEKRNPPSDLVMNTNVEYN